MVCWGEYVWVLILVCHYRTTGWSPLAAEFLKDISELLKQNSVIYKLLLYK